MTTFQIRKNVEGRWIVWNDVKHVTVSRGESFETATLAKAWVWANYEGVEVEVTS